MLEDDVRAVMDHACPLKPDIVVPVPPEQQSGAIVREATRHTGLGAGVNAASRLDDRDEFAPDVTEDSGGFELAALGDQVMACAGNPDDQLVVHLLEAAI